MRGGNTQGRHLVCYGIWKCFEEDFQTFKNSVNAIPVGNETWYATKCGGSKVQISVNLTININTDKTISHASPSQIAQKFSSKQDTTLATGSENFVAIGIWEMDLR